MSDVNDIYVIRQWQADAGPPATRAELDRWLVHQYGEAETEAACLLARDPKAWKFASVRFTASPPDAAPLPPAPPRDESTPKKRRPRTARSGPLPRTAPPAYRTVTTPLIGGRRYYDDVIAELAAYPGEWAIVVAAQTNNGIANILKRKGCEATTRGRHGDITVYARWNP